MGKFETEKAHIVTIQVLAALMTTSVSRAILRALCDHAEDRDKDCVCPTERWATTFWSIAQFILMEIAASYGYPPPNLGELPVSGS